MAEGPAYANNDRMGGTGEFEDLAEGKADAPTAIAMLD